MIVSVCVPIVQLVRTQHVSNNDQQTQSQLDMSN